MKPGDDRNVQSEYSSLLNNKKDHNRDSIHDNSFRAGSCDRNYASFDGTLSSSSVGDPDQQMDPYTLHNLSLKKGPILLSLWSGSFLSSLDATIVAIIMNRVSEEFQESDKKQWIATSYLLTNTAFQPLYGRLSDIIGRKNAQLIALFFFGIGSLLTTFSTNLTQFALSRAISGIGGGGISSMSSITVGDICTVKERGIYQGYANIFYAAGQILGAPLGGLMIETVGWRVIFGCQVPFVMVAMFLSFTYVNVKLAHLPPKEERYKWKNLSRLDIFGSFTLVSSISFLIVLLSDNDLNKFKLGVLTIFSFILFLIIEKYYSKNQILPLKYFKGSFGLVSITVILSSYIVFGEYFRTPIYLQVVQNFSITLTGLYLIFPTLFVAAGSIYTGRILKKTTMDLERCSYNIILFGAAIQCIGLIILMALLANLDIYDSNTMKLDISKIFHEISSIEHTWKIILCIAVSLITYGYASILVSTLVTIVYNVEKSKQGSFTGVYYLWRSLGNVLGTSVTLVIYENGLSKNLHKYMLEGQNKTGYNFTIEEYRALLKDSGYLRRHFPKEISYQLLNVYKNAFVRSYLPNLSLSVLSLITAYFILRRFKPKTKFSGDC